MDSPPQHHQRLTKIRRLSRNKKVGRRLKCQEARRQAAGTLEQRRCGTVKGLHEHGGGAARLHPRTCSGRTCPGPISAAAPHLQPLPGPRTAMEPHCSPLSFQTTTHPSFVQKPVSLEAPAALPCPLSPPGSCRWPLGHSCCSLRTVVPSSHYLLQHLCLASSHGPRGL